MARRYQPWLTLQETVDLIAPGDPDAQADAQADICQALRDGTIKFHVLIDVSDIIYGGRWVGHDISTGSSVVRRANTDEIIGVRVPSDLRPERLDWVTSRPLERWEVGVDVPNPEEDLAGYVPRTIARLELLGGDVLERFYLVEPPAPEPGSQQEQPAQPSGPPPGRPATETARVRDRMLADLRSGRISTEDLRTVKADSLAHEHGTTRYIIGKARKAALQLFEK